MSSNVKEQWKCFWALPYIPSRVLIWHHFFWVLLMFAFFLQDKGWIFLVLALLHLWAIYNVTQDVIKWGRRSMLMDKIFLTKTENTNEKAP